MRTKSKGYEAITRKAFIWEEPEAPPLRDLFGDAEARTGFFRYWVRDTIHDLPKVIGYHAMRLFPPAVASALGALHYGIMGRFYPVLSARMADNCRHIRPDLDPERAVHNAWRNRGRLMAEYSVARRIDTGNRIRIEDANHLIDARAKGSVLILSMHVGNWELLACVLKRLGVRPATLYLPPKSRHERAVSRRLRRSYDVDLLPPGVKGVRPAMKLLAKPDGVVNIFGDEGFGGRIMAPFFGRETHLSGNLAIAVRLARHSGASIVPVCVPRVGAARFVCRFLPAIELEPVADPGAALLADVERVNSAIEPIVREYVDQWFFLDHRL